MGRDQEQHERRDRDQGAAARAEPPPFWEWVVAAIGLVLLLAALGYLTWQALQPDTPPAPVVETTAIEAQDGRFVVRFRVHNRGTTTAERLKVAGRLARLGVVVEESDTEFDFLPGESTREGGLFFSRDPRTLDLRIEARSYQKP